MVSLALTHGITVIFIRALLVVVACDQVTHDVLMLPFPDGKSRLERCGSWMFHGVEPETLCCQGSHPDTNISGYVNSIITVKYR